MSRAPLAGRKRRRQEEVEKVRFKDTGLESVIMVPRVCEHDSILKKGKGRIRNRGFGKWVPGEERHK